MPSSQAATGRANDQYKWSERGLTRSNKSCCAKYPVTVDSFDPGILRRMKASRNRPARGFEVWEVRWIGFGFVVVGERVVVVVVRGRCSFQW